MGARLSIDISKTNIHIVEGSFIKGNLQIEKAASFRIAAETFNGETINDLDILAENIIMNIKKSGFSSSEAVVTIDAYGSVIRDIAIPNAKPKEMADMIRTEMIQTYQVQPTDVIQFKGIEMSDNEADKQLMNFRAAAIGQDIVEIYHDLLIGAKLKPMAMDININAIDKLMAGELIINDKIINGNGTMLIDFGDTITTVYIKTQGKPMFYRHIDFGCGDIERIISSETYAPEEDIKKMKEDGFNFFKTGEGEEKYFGIIRPFIYNLTDEIRKIISFYTSRSNTHNIDQIFLFGGGSNLVGFAEHCENNFNVPTEQIIKLSKVKFKDSNTPVASYMNAIGALIRY